MQKLFLSLVAAVALTGCVAYHSAPFDRRITVSPELGSAIWVTDVRLTKTTSLQYTMQANIVNNTSGVVEVEYRTVWLDSNGTELPSVVSSWTPMSAAPREVVGLASTAPSPDAVDFRFYVQSSRH